MPVRFLAAFSTLIILLAGLTGFSISPVQAQIIDSTFHPDLGMAEVTGIYLGPDNKYYVIGDLYPSSGRKLVVRINQNGQIDSSFNAAPLGGWVYDLAFDGDKIFMAGSFDSVGGTPRGGIARLLNNGSLDPNFDSSWLSTPYGGIEQIQMGPGGSVYASSSGFDGGLQRFTSSGSLDSGFNITGTVGNSGKAYAWTLRENGRLLWVGTHRETPDDNSTGWVDTAIEFNSSGGKIQTVGALESVTDFFYRTDNRLLVFGSFLTSPGGDTFTDIAKFDSNLQREWTFVPDDLRYFVPWGLGELIDGRTLLMSQYRWVDEDQSTISNRLGRVLQDGSRDLSWNEVIFTPKSSMLKALLIEPDGTTLVGGTFTHVNGNSQYSIVRVRITDVEDPEIILRDRFEGN